MHGQVNDMIDGCTSKKANGNCNVYKFYNELNFYLDNKIRIVAASIS